MERQYLFGQSQLAPVVETRQPDYLVERGPHPMFSLGPDYLVENEKEKETRHPIFSLRRLSH